MGRNDLMAALLETRRVLDERVTALGKQVEETRREVTEGASARASELHADNRETRSSVNRLSSEVDKTLPRLRQDVTDLARGFDELRSTVADLIAQLPAATPAVPAADGPHTAQEPQHTEPEASPRDGAPALAAPANTAAPAKGGAVVTAPAEDRGGQGPGTAAGESGGLPVDEAGLEAASRRQAASDAAAAGAGAENAHGPDRPAATPGPAPSGRQRDELAEHDLVLASAATVGTVDLVCHRDLWEFVLGHAQKVEHFRKPAAPTEEGRDRLRITLSGRSVIAVLMAMRGTRIASAPYGKNDGSWVLAGQVYERLAHDLTTTSRSGTRPLTVVFDDGISDVSSPKDPDTRQQ
ncbi:hypothetical protein V1J52_25200 [Streptomyces sp. TRM 70351]|uniref:hypothetical protein n=1 Tax=Streptomyces sp. TRM 70351 TaxID=3116552 RepID=UPI002E7AF64F|nr:hypothetical protein [Streptomyces sp. TRM 70351]MEE1931421.1 hypothetical protein [Streptomyces sp. TRM 70351]